MKGDKGVLIDTGCNCGGRLAKIQEPVAPPKWGCPLKKETCQRPTCDECVTVIIALREMKSRTLVKVKST